jgi:hypothetical protein
MMSFSDEQERLRLFGYDAARTRRNPHTMRLLIDTLRSSDTRGIIRPYSKLAHALTLLLFDQRVTTDRRGERYSPRDIALRVMNRAPKESHATGELVSRETNGITLYATPWTWNRIDLFRITLGRAIFRCSEPNPTLVTVAALLGDDLFYNIYSCETDQVSVLVFVFISVLDQLGDQRLTHVLFPAILFGEIPDIQTVFRKGVDTVALILVTIDPCLDHDP